MHGNYGLTKPDTHKKAANQAAFLTTVKTLYLNVYLAPMVYLEPY